MRKAGMPLMRLDFAQAELIYNALTIYVKLALKSGDSAKEWKYSLYHVVANPPDESQ